MYRISVAPMMDWTDKHCRYLLRLLSPSVLLYTEMVVTGAIIHGDRQRFLGYDAIEHPLVLQLGGHDPAELAYCSQIAEALGYDEINLNVGCPSSRVQSGRFGACLMREPELVAECIAAMEAAVSIPVTVKTRVGVDECDDYTFLHQFIQTVSEAGCKLFVIHARKAWLKGLSPKQNREVPPLQYEKVQQLKKDFPQLQFVLNGGITNIEQAQTLHTEFDGLMLGRAVYQNPMLLVELEQAFFDSDYTIDIINVLEQYTQYAAKQVTQGVPLNILTKPLLGLFNGCRGAKAWRRTLAEKTRDCCDVNVIWHALDYTDAASSASS